MMGKEVGVITKLTESRDSENRVGGVFYMRLLLICYDDTCQMLTHSAGMEESPWRAQTVR